MVTESRPRVAGAFGAIADPTRRAILDLLRGHELSAGDIADRFTVSRPAISKHVRLLRRAGLVRERREAQSRFYSVDPAPLAEVDRWLERYRMARLPDLKRLGEEDTRRKR